MKYTIIILFALLTNGAHAACPPQPAEIVATNNEISVCSEEPLTGIDLKVGTTALPRIALAVPSGTPVRVIGLNSCSGMLSVAGVNEAGVGQWGLPVKTTFLPCTNTRVGGPLP